MASSPTVAPLHHRALCHHADLVPLPLTQSLPPLLRARPLRLPPLLRLLFRIRRHLCLSFGSATFATSRASSSSLSEGGNLISGLLDSSAASPLPWRLCLLAQPYTSASGGSSRLRLMCSYGGRIVHSAPLPPPPHAPCCSDLRSKPSTPPPTMSSQPTSNASTAPFCPPPLSLRRTTATAPLPRCHPISHRCSSVRSHRCLPAASALHTPHSDPPLLRPGESDPTRFSRSDPFQQVEIRSASASVPSASRVDSTLTCSAQCMPCTTSSASLLNPLHHGISTSSVSAPPLLCCILLSFS